MQIMLLFTPFPCTAFYNYEGAGTRFEARGFLQLLGLFSHNPDSRYFYPNEFDQAYNAMGRLLLDVGIGERVAFEVNLYQYYTHATQKVIQDQWTFAAGTERNPALDYIWGNDAYNEGLLAVDRLNARFMLEDMDITVGRRPINLATTFYFTPNDFFAPFAAETFFRVYKPGVDSLLVEASLGELSRISLMGVLGYNPNPSNSSGWSGGVSWKRSSALVRVSTSWSGFDWSVLAGRVRESTVIGFALQGEVKDLFGLRAEGHYAKPQDGLSGSYTELTVALERRFENTLEVRVEQFYHGSGSESVKDYSRTMGPTSIPYLGKNYTALGITYEANPLLQVELLSMLNWTDKSTLFSFYSVYSLSNESELALGFSIPFGKGPEGKSLESEFGTYPSTLGLEYRLYF